MRILTGGRGLLVLAASVLALAGLTQLMLGWLPAFGSAAPPPQPSALASDGVAARVVQSSWIAHDHNATGTGVGYQMPLSMMPGMPADGKLRLAVSVTVTNTATVGRLVTPADEFTLRDAGSDESWRPVADTFEGLSRLGSSSAADGVIFFDVPEQKVGEGQLYVDWKHAGRSARLSVQPGQDAGVHSHE